MKEIKFIHGDALSHDPSANIIIYVLMINTAIEIKICEKYAIAWGLTTKQHDRHVLSFIFFFVVVLESPLSISVFFSEFILK